MTRKTSSTAWATDRDERHARRASACPTVPADALNGDRPTIVHFSGRGAGTPGIAFSSDSGPQLVGAETLRQLFTALKDNIRVVVLNACYRGRQ
jgi:CHAT domain-containing protein